jgi:hypothetical protein
MPRAQNKNRTPKAAKEKHHITDKGKPIKITADLSEMQKINGVMYFKS